MTLGQLDIFGRTTFGLTGAGSLSFDNHNEAASLTVSSQWQLDNRIGVPISLPADGQLVIDVARGSLLALEGAITDGSGDVVKKNAGTLKLTGANPDWGGALTLKQGELRVEHTKSLVNTSAVTAEPGSYVTIVAQQATLEDTRARYEIPRLILDGATLQSNLGARRDITSFNTDIELRSDSIIRSPTGSHGLLIEGTISGSGGVSFVQHVNPGMRNDFSRFRINGETSYSGETLVSPGVSVEFLKSAAFGDTTGGTRILRGEVYLHEGGGAESISIDHGRLDLGDAITPYGHTVFLNSSNLTGGGATHLAL